MDQFNSISAGLTSPASSLNTTVKTDVAQINQLASQAASLNQQLVEAQASGQGSGTVSDQLNAVELQLAGLTNLSVTHTSGGDSLSIGNGTPLVLGSQSYALSTTTNSSGNLQVLDSGGTNITSSISGGDLGGTIQVRDTDLPGLSTSLDTLANQFATAFNTAQAGGFNQNGTAGTALFTIPTTVAGSAAAIKLATTDPTTIAASSDSASGGNGNVANLTALQNTVLPAGQSATTTASNLVYQVGHLTSTATAESTATQLSLTTLKNEQSSVSGVSIDEESANLVRYQQAYEAAAKVVTTIASLFDTTINMISGILKGIDMRFVPNIAANVISDIQSSEQNLSTALQQVSSGQRVSVPSDDPAAAAALVQLQAKAANVDQYTTNAESVLSQAQGADSVLTSVVSLLNQAITTGTEGANSTSSTSDRQTLATTIQGILSNVVSLANTTYQGISLFGGTVSEKQAFTADASSSTGYTYNGNSSVNSVQVGDTLTVQANIPGSTLFDNSSTSVLGALSGLSKALSSGSSSAIGTATNAVTSALNYVTQQHVIYGNSINQLTSQETYLASDTVTLTASESSLTGIDTATAAENLTSAETDNSAVLAAAAKVLQNTLLDYLK